MIVLYILAVILAIIIILFHIPFRFYVSCVENKITVTLKYLFFKLKLYPVPESTEKKKKADKKKKPDKKNDDEPKKKSKLIPESTDERIELVINILKSSGKALRVFTKRIAIKNIRANLDISDEDACECAIKFGKTNIAVFNIVSFAGIFFRVKKKYININCVYNKPQSIYNFSFNVNVTLAGALSALTAFIFTFIANNIKAGREARKTNIPQT